MLKAGSSLAPQSQGHTGSLEPCNTDALLGAASVCPLPLRLESPNPRDSLCLESKKAGLGCGKLKGGLFIVGELVISFHTPDF